MKRTYIILGIIMLIFTFYQIATSYAKYIAEATAVVEKQAGAWAIKVNDTDISNSNSETTFNVDNLIFPESAFVAENKLAPGANGYFEIIIDSTGSSVAVRYDVTLVVDNLNIIDSIRFTKACIVVDGEEIEEGIIKTGDNTYSGVISLEDVTNEVQTTLRFYIGWEELENGQGDIADTELGLIKDISTNIPVDVVITQYLGEPIVAIQENI
ncbi:MAG TPA: hypothetical protein DEP51_06755 [Clostridiales bacterium]|nr:hypothetical protein [Clostridiales bacterium]